MLIKGIFTNVSGSIGGVTGSRNKAGQYLRARTSPVNPNTTAQQDARSRFTAANEAWSGLTQSQRNAWNEFATAQAWTNALGDSIQLSGQQAYVGSHSTLQAAELTPVIVPPQPNTRPASPEIGQINYDIGEDAFIGTPNGTLEAADRYLVSGSAILPPGVSRFKGPFRVVASITGNLATGPAGIQIAAGYRTKLPMPTLEQRVALRFVAVLATGQYSNPAIIVTNPTTDL